MRRVAVLCGLLTVGVLAGCVGPKAGGAEPSDPGVETKPVALPQGLDLSKANRRAPIAGLPDWSHAGYRDGENLPGAGDYNPDHNCRITPEELAGYGVKPNDEQDDTAGLQRAIDRIGKDCSPSASFSKLSLIILPAGKLVVTKQLWVDADYLTIRGAGAETKVVFRPDADTRYDKLTADGGEWDQDATSCGKGPKGGWLWPGRALFRVQSRAVEKSYVDSCTEPNRSDLAAGTVNAHWKAGVKLLATQGEYGGRAADTKVRVAKSEPFKAGTFVDIRAANTM